MLPSLMGGPARVRLLSEATLGVQSHTCTWSWLCLFSTVPPRLVEFPFPYL